VSILRAPIPARQSDFFGGIVDWVFFSKVFEVLVNLMNTLSRHFTSRLDESVVSNPLPEIRLDGVKSSR
jgi:hypothetical protein